VKTQSLHMRTQQPPLMGIESGLHLHGSGWSTLTRPNPGSYIARLYISIDKLKTEISAITTHDSSLTT
jgi:hypothetical protein